ncbi:MAG: hypothetical protein ACRC2U_19780 [Aeromonas sp.]
MRKPANAPHVRIPDDTTLGDFVMQQLDVPNPLTRFMMRPDTVRWYHQSADWQTFAAFSEGIGLRPTLVAMCEDMVIDQVPYWVCTILLEQVH